MLSFPCSSPNPSSSSICDFISPNFFEPSPNSHLLSIAGSKAALYHRPPCLRRVVRPRPHQEEMKQRLMKIRVTARKVYDYIRYDLKEIAFPSSLPNPPGYVEPRKLTMKEWYEVVKEACHLYAASWVRDIGPDLRPNDYKKAEGSKSSGTDEKELSTLEDLAIAARGGMEHLKPALQRLYMTRASAYKDAMKSFVEGYKEGLQQVAEKKDEPLWPDNKDDPKKPT